MKIEEIYSTDKTSKEATKRKIVMILFDNNEEIEAAADLLANANLTKGESSYSQAQDHFRTTLLEEFETLLKR